MSSKNKTQNSDSISKIYKSRNIILNQLERRGFDTSSYTGFSINEISVMNKNETLDMFLKNETTGKKVFIKYHLNTKIRDTAIYEYLDDLFNVEEMLDKSDDLIVIAKEKPNDTQIKLMETLYETDGYYFNIFNYNNYLFNILEHSMVPEHTVLSLEEKEEVKVRYNINKDSEFPEISRFDPVAQAIGLRPGEVCKIIRSSETALQTEYYRLCI